MTSVRKIKRNKPLPRSKQQRQFEVAVRMMEATLEVVRGSTIIDPRGGLMKVGVAPSLLKSTEVFLPNKLLTIR